MASLDEDSAGLIRHHRFSLDRRLPLMISGLIAVTITAFGIIAYTEVRQTTSSAATAQLRTVLGQTVESSGKSVAARLDAMSRLVKDSTIAGALTLAEDAPVDGARRLLELRRLPADSLTLLAQLMVTPAGSVRLLTGVAPTAKDRAMLDSTIADVETRNRAAISPFFESHGEVHYWLVAPVSKSDQNGFFAEQRRLRGAPGLEKQIKAITGLDLTIYYSRLNGSEWSTVAGDPITPRFQARQVPDSFKVAASDGQQILGVKTQIPGTQWIAIFTTPESAVQLRAEMFLRRMLLIAVILLIVGMLGARWVSGQVTRPLQSLTKAAREVARGEFGRRELATSDDEIGQLARAFNQMAERVGRSHEQLQMRIRESEALASTLSMRNLDLQVAQHTATEARIASDAARADAQRANLAKSEFLAMMSHELRTPLSAIAGYAEILQLGIRGPLNEAQRADLTRIQANQSHLLHIINDILDLTQVESGQIAIERKALSLGDVLSDLEPIVAPLLEEKALSFRVDPLARATTVLGERERLTQVLVNLVANAIRFTEPGGCISIEAISTSSFVRICVTDTGVGIPVDKHESIFQPFVQVEGGPSRHTQGTGLGLAISRRLVEAMGGTLSLQSEVGIGSTFTIELAAAPRQSYAELSARAS